MKIGLALGSGSARGFSHIGIIDCLLDQGIVPDVVAGTSIGAIVGASYASGHLERLRKAALGINRLNWTTFFNPSFSFDGWINIRQMQLFLVKSGIERKQKRIEDLKIPFGTVTCDLMSGKEIWLTKGPVFDAVWPSMAMPGVFPPVPGPEDRWFIDGGIVNPVPVSLCRALGADVVIAVNLNNDLLRRVDIERVAKTHGQKKTSVHKKTSEMSRLIEKAKNMWPSKKKEEEDDKPVPPDFFETISRSINIAQDRITKTRLAGDPPEIILCPRVSDIGLLETYRAKEAIREGYKCAEANIEAIKDAVL